MFRSALRSFSLAAGRVAPTRPHFHQRAKLHSVSPLPFDPNNGLAPLFSPAALNILYGAHQHQMIHELNDLIEGTVYENQPIYSTILATCHFLPKANVFNVASQAWNNDFFLQKLSPVEKNISYQLEEKLKRTWGSVEEFKLDFKYHALGIFGCGWTWLVEDEHGLLKIVNTYNAGTPHAPQRLQEVDSNNVVTSASKGIHDTSKPAPIVPLEGLRNLPQNSFAPLFCLNMWQHAYLPDYGLHGREEYINRFWTVLDWDKVVLREQRR